jgi:hypothetical protein
MARQAGDWLDSYIRLTDNSEPPVLFRKWIGVSVIAAVMQRKCFLEWGDDITDFPNFYIILTSPPGRARKGIAMRQGKKFLKDKRALSIRIAPDRTTPESLIKDLSEAGQPAKYLDNGKEKIFSHNSMTVFSSELTVFLGHQNDVFLNDLTDLYDSGDEWIYRTKNMGEFIVNGVWLNLVGATTPKLIQTSLPLQAIGGGLTSRMIFIFSDAKPEKKATPFATPADRALRLKLQQDLLDISQICGPYKTTTEFIEAYSLWYEGEGSKPTFDDDRFEYYFERKQTTLRKLSLVMAASRRDERVLEEGDFYRALEWLEDAEVPMRGALRGVGRIPTAELLMRVSREILLRKETTLSWLTKKFEFDATPKDMSDVLLTLEIQKFCSVYEGSGKIVFNPNFKEDQP